MQKLVDDETLRKSAFSQERIKVQTSVSNRILKIYRIPLSIKTYLSMTLYHETYLKIIQSAFQMRLRATHFSHSDFLLRSHPNSVRSLKIIIVHARVVANEKQYFPRFHFVNSTVLCIVNRKPSVLCRAMHNYHSLYHWQRACSLLHWRYTGIISDGRWFTSAYCSARAARSAVRLRSLLAVGSLARECDSRKLFAPPECRKFGRGASGGRSTTTIRYLCAYVLRFAMKKSKVNARCQKKTHANEKRRLEAALPEGPPMQRPRTRSSRHNIGLAPAR